MRPFAACTTTTCILLSTTFCLLHCSISFGLTLRQADEIAETKPLKVNWVICRINKRSKQFGKRPHCCRVHAFARMLHFTLGRHMTLPKLKSVSYLEVRVVYGYSSSQCNVATPLRELTCHMGSHSVTCHPAEVTYLYPQTKLVLDLAIPERCKAELT